MAQSQDMEGEVICRREHGMLYTLWRQAILPKNTQNATTLYYSLFFLFQILSFILPVTLQPLLLGGSRGGRNGSLLFNKYCHVVIDYKQRINWHIQFIRINQKTGNICRRVQKYGFSSYRLNPFACSRFHYESKTVSTQELLMRNCLWREHGKGRLEYIFFYK